jgi:hypothetical protein
MQEAIMGISASMTSLNECNVPANVDDDSELWRELEDLMTMQDPVPIKIPAVKPVDASTETAIVETAMMPTTETAKPVVETAMPFEIDREAVYA